MDEDDDSNIDIEKFKRELTDDQNDTNYINNISTLESINDTGNDDKNYDDKARENNTHFPNITEEEEDNEENNSANARVSEEDIRFIIKTMIKEAPHDECSIKQLFYGMMSAFTKVPIPHVVNSKDSGAGKSYLLNLVASYFPPKYVIIFSGMSDKSLYHRDGIMVVEDEKTGETKRLDPILNELSITKEELLEQIEDEKAKAIHSQKDKELIKNNKEKIKVIETQIADLHNKSQKLIDLNNQIIIFSDTPPPTLLDSLMALLSQDTPKDQKYSFVEKSGSGKIATKINRLRGMPVLFTTQVIDDTNNKRYEEKNRRFVHVTPDTSIQKINSAKMLIGLRYGSTAEEYDLNVVSREDKEKAKKIIQVLIAKLKQHSTYFQPKQPGVKIPFATSIMAGIPDNRVWDMTVAERTMKYLSIITKINKDNRPSLVNTNTGQIYPISIPSDLKETLLLMEKGASGLRPYIASWYNSVFLPSFRELDDRPNEDRDDVGKVLVKEKRVGLTTDQLADKTKEIFGGPKLGSKEIRDKFIYPLINQGIIDQIRSEIDNRQNICFPVDENNLFSMFDSSSKEFRLKISSPDLYPRKKILEESFRFLSKKNAEEGVCSDKNYYYKLIDTNGEEITVGQLLDKYFSNIEDCFTEGYDDDTNEDNNKEMPNDIPTATAVIKDHIYSQQLILSKNNFLSIPHGLRSIFTEFHNNHTSNSSTVELDAIGKNKSSKVPIMSVDDFFHDNPAMPYQPLADHSLAQSPCYPIIIKKDKYYFCRLHLEFKNIHLESIEHHCKYSEPNIHRERILSCMKINRLEFHEGKAE